MNRLSPVIKKGGMPLILMHGDGFFATPSEDLGDDPEGVIGLLVVAAFLPFR
jgi:hypothetical protein